MGAQMIEMDLHATADGHVVVIHDDDLSRTTDRPGRISRKTLEEVRRADAGKGERVPTLAEAIELARGKVELYLEIKDPKAAALTVKTVREMGFEKDALLASFDSRTMRQLRAEVSDIRLGLIVGVPTLNPLTMSKDTIPWVVSRNMNFEVMSIETVLCKPMLVERLRREGMKLYVWTANDERAFQKIVACGVEGIVTNYPDRLIAFLGEQNRSL